MGNKVFTFGDIRIREVKGKYYVYLIEKDNEGNRRDHYVGSLDQIVKDYISIKVRGTGFEPAQAFASGASVRPLCPDSGTPAHQYFILTRYKVLP